MMVVRIVGLSTFLELQGDANFQLCGLFRLDFNVQ